MNLELYLLKGKNVINTKYVQKGLVVPYAKPNKYRGTQGPQ